MSIKTFAEKLAECDPEALRQYYKILSVEDFDGEADVHTQNGVFRVDYTCDWKYNRAVPRTRDYPGDEAYVYVILTDYRIRIMDDEVAHNVWLHPTVEKHIINALVDELNKTVNDER